MQDFQQVYLFFIIILVFIMLVIFFVASDNYYAAKLVEQVVDFDKLAANLETEA